MIFEVKESVWWVMTDIAKDSILRKKDIQVRLYREALTKKGVKKVPTMIIAGEI